MGQKLGEGSLRKERANESDVVKRGKDKNNSDRIKRQNL
jgi:hypothetical protein